MQSELNGIDQQIEKYSLKNRFISGGFFEITQDTMAALFLSQLYYWTKRCKDPDGWFYKTREEWEKELGLSRRAQESIRKQLRELKVLEEKTAGAPPKIYFRLNLEKIAELLVLDNCDELVEQATQTGQQVQNVPLDGYKTYHLTGTERAIQQVQNVPLDRYKAYHLTGTDRTTPYTKNTTKSTAENTTKSIPNINSVSQKLDHPVDKKTIVEIFEHWKEVMGHSKAQLDDKRRSLIRKALKMGYSQAQLFQAINGCALTPHNIGENDRGQRYDGLHILFRSADQIDRFMRNAESPPRVLNKTQQSEAHNDRVVGNVLRQLATGEMAL